MTGRSVISLRDYEGVLKDLGKEYFIQDLQYVADINAWVKKNNTRLSEPHQFMKLITDERTGLIMVMQSDVVTELDDVIENLGVRWALKDTATNMDAKLNSVKKRIIYCFLKEYARSVKRIGEAELVQDEWALSEMESLGYFNE